MIRSATLTFQRFYHDSGRAILVGYNNEKYWIPKMFCRNLVVNNKLGGHVSIPTFKFIEITGNEPDENNADYIIEKHIPEKIEPKEIKANADLIR
jgi:hypothetical protein